MMENNMELTLATSGLREQSQPPPRSDLHGLYELNPLTCGPGESNFRLLHLRGPSASNDLESGGDPLTGRLEVASLNDAPNFTALSYVWGVAHSEEEFILCDSSDCGFYKIPLTTNCYNVLLHLRRHFGPLTLWIDAICIDQESVIEKNNQLPLMGQIYDSARIVFIWLGEGTLASDNAMKCFGDAWRLGVPRSNGRGILQRLVLNLMRRYIFNLVYNKTWEFSGQAVGLKQILTKSVMKTNLIRSQYSAKNLEDILDRAWCKRAWTFQEMLVARHPIILCGNEMLDWPNFIFGMAYVLACANRGDKISIPRPSFEAWQSLIGLWATVDWYNRRQGKRSRKHRDKEAKITIWSSRDRNKAFTLREERELIIRRFLPLPGTEASRNMLLLCVNILALGAPIGLLTVIIWAGVNKKWGAFFAFLLFVLIVVIGFGIHCKYHGGFWELLGAFWEGLKEVRQWLIRGGPPGIVFKEAFVHALRERKAGNPRDKSYAMYSILERAGVRLTAADYAKCPFEVYTDLFLDLVVWDPDMLRLILDAGLSMGRSRPSWVPDWSDDGWRTWLDSRYIYFRNQYSATAGSENVEPGTRRGTEPALILSGKWIDNCWLSCIIPSRTHLQTLTIPHTISTSTASTNAGLSILVEWIMAIHFNAVARDITIEHARSIYEVLEGKLFREGGFQTPSGFKKWLDHIHGFIGSGSLFLEQLQEIISADEETAAWHQRCLENLHNQRSLCITTTGWFGSGPLDMAIGDRVALVSNVPVPLVFRRSLPNSEEYIFVGPAFIAGSMTGELWNNTENDQIVVV